MCRLYPVTVYWSWELASVWDCCISPHLYQMLLKEKPRRPPAPTAHFCLSNEATYPSWLQSRNKKNDCQHHNENERGSQAQVTDVMSLSIQCPPGPIVAVRLQPPLSHTHGPIPSCSPAHHSLSRCHWLWEKMKIWMQSNLSVHLLQHIQELLSDAERTVLKRSAGTLTCKTIRLFLVMYTEFNLNLMLL